MKVAELKEALSERGLKVSGLKAELTERLLAAIGGGTNDALAATAAPPPAASPAAAPPEGIQALLKERMKVAMKAGAGGKQELAAVRLMVAAMTTKQKEDNSDGLNDAEAQDVLAKLAKMRKESIDMYEKAGKSEAAASEKFELSILEEYLPEMADEATVRGWIAVAIEEACPDGADKKLMGKVMGALMKAHKGEFDGKEANPWVSQMLAEAAAA